MDVRQSKMSLFLTSTELSIMGQSHNRGIARKTIAHEVVITIHENSLEGMHSRRWQFNYASWRGLFRFSRLLGIIQRRRMRQSVAVASEPEARQSVGAGSILR